MNGKFIVTVLVIIAIVFTVYLLIPADMGIKNQLSQFGSWCAKYIVGGSVWLVEAIILLIGPAIIGCFRPVKMINEDILPGTELNGWERTILHIGMIIAIFFLWLLMPVLATILPPLNNYYIGPWIKSYMESGLVWWGAGAVVEYLFTYGLASIDWSF